jgi:hypothetical protein
MRYRTTTSRLKNLLRTDTGRTALEELRAFCQPDSRPVSEASYRILGNVGLMFPAFISGHPSVEESVQWIVLATVQGEGAGLYITNAVESVQYRH